MLESQPRETQPKIRQQYFQLLYEMLHSSAPKTVPTTTAGELSSRDAEGSAETASHNSTQ
jgi:hypothetical protein